MNKSNLRALLTPIVLALAIVFGMMLNRFLPDRTQVSASSEMFLPVTGSKLDLIISMIQNSYVDTVDTRQIVENTIPVLLKDLDPHTVYIPAKDMQRANEGVVGNFGGVGIQFYKYLDTVTVVKVVPGGPSEKAGIKDGDRIVRVHDSLLDGVKMSQDKIQELMRGELGTKVELTIARRGEPKLITKEVVRGSIPVKSVDVAYMLNDTTGYLKTNTFGMHTYAEFMQALVKLKAEGMRKIIIDLRENEGGVLPIAIQMINEFLDADRLILYTQGQAQPRADYKSNGKGQFKDLRVDVLISEFSASASEIFAGAIQDNDRGLIIGRRSFGKGLVQEQRMLPDGSALRLTVARYYTPAGRCIQKPYESIEKYNEDLIDRYNKGEMMSEDSIHFPDSLKFKTHRLARTVYGGGGIMPDYFVPIDTTLYTKYHRQLRDKGALMKAHFHFIDAHRKEWLGKYKTFNEFYKRFEVTPDMLAQLVATGKEMGVEYNEEEYQKALPLLKLQMKALIARDLWDMNEYYHVINDANESIRKALELLEQPDFEGLLLKKR